MKKRTFLTVVLCVLLPFVLLGFAHYGYEMYLEKRAAMEYSLQQSAMVIQNQLTELELEAEHLCLYTSVQEAMAQGIEQQSKNAQIDELRQLNTIVQRSELNRAVHDVRLYFTKNKFYTTEQISFFPFSLFEGDEQLREPSILGQFSGVYQKQYKDKKAATVITYYRLITQTTPTLPVIGAICLDLDIDYLSSLIQPPQDLGLTALALLNTDGSVLFCASAEEERDFFLEKARAYLQSSEESPKNLLVAHTTAPHWLLFGWMEAPFAGLAGTSTQTFFVALIAVALFSLAVVVLITIAVTQRVEALVMLLERGAQPKPRKIRAGRILLLSRLSSSVEHVRSLLEWRKQQLVIQQQTQLQLLQAQINPHFLYNALDCANWLIRSQQLETASEVVLAIGRFYRLALNKGADELTVEEDLELAISYARIQECRLDGNVQLQTHIQEAAKGCLVPKMTLQPIIENAIMHGFLKKLKDARIDIDISLSDGFLTMTICDNGVGMSAEKAASLCRADSGTGGFGIRAVHERCQLFSGREDCGVTIESEEGSYTLVTVQVIEKRKPLLPL